MSLIDEANRAKVRFIDFLTPDLLKEYYYASDIFAMPSRGDVWGLVVGEAMACGLPVIASEKCLAAKSMIKQGKNGYVINENENVKEYVKVINEVAANKKLRMEMTKNNLEKIQKYAVDVSGKYDYDNILNYLKEI